MSEAGEISSGSISRVSFFLLISLDVLDALELIDFLSSILSSLKSSSRSSVEGFSLSRTLAIFLVIGTDRNERIEITYDEIHHPSKVCENPPQMLSWNSVKACEKAKHGY